jgi:hypothetical protein
MMLFVGIFAGGISVTVSAQGTGTFQNPAFEYAKPVPIVDSPYAPEAVTAASAFPGWTVGGGDDSDGGTGPLVLYPGEFVELPSVQLIGPVNYEGIAPLQGSYSAGLEYNSGSFDPPTLSQKGMIPATAQSINFLFSPLPGNSSTAIVEVNGVSIPLFPIAGGRLAGNISVWAGQTAEIKFTTPSTGNTFFYFDDVNFSPTAVIPEPPIIAPITNETIFPDTTLAFNIQASDSYGDQLTFSLDSGAPSGAQIDPTNGSFLWLPTLAQASSTNSIAVVVTENSSPFLSSTDTFVVVVEDYIELTVGSTNVLGGQTTSVPLTLSSSDGVTNVVFSIQMSETIFTNASIVRTAPETGLMSVTDHGASLFVAIQSSSGQVFRGTEQLAQLSFLAVPNPPSAFVPLRVENISAAKPDGSAYINYMTQPGLIIDVQDRPILTAALGASMQSKLTLYGLPGANYQIQSATNLNYPVVWVPLLNYVQTSAVITTNVATMSDTVFYRLSAP